MDIEFWKLGVCRYICILNIITSYLSAVSLENVVHGQGAVPVERRALRGQQFLSNAGQPIWSFGLRPSCVLIPTSQPHDQLAPLSQSQCQNSSIADLLSGAEVLISSIFYGYCLLYVFCIQDMKSLKKLEFKQALLLYFKMCCAF